MMSFSEATAQAARSVAAQPEDTVRRDLETTAEGRPKRFRLKRIARFKRKRIATLGKRVASPGSTVVTDGLSSFRGVTDAGLAHQVVVTGKGYRAARIPASQR